MNAQFDIISSAPIDEICAARSQAFEIFDQLMEAVDRSKDLLKQLSGIEIRAAQGKSVYLPTDKLNDFKTAVQQMASADELKPIHRHHVDAAIWNGFMETFSLYDVMNHKQREDFDKNLQSEIPDATEENLRATIEDLLSNSRQTFLEGLAQSFASLDRRFKSHDTFKVKSRIILERCFDGWFRHGTRSRQVDDVGKAIQVMLGHKGFVMITKVIESERGSRWSPAQSEHELLGLLIRVYKNGNVHIWFKDKALLSQVNQCLAEYYGEVLADGVEKTPKKARTTEIAKDLQFYPTPEALAKKVLFDAHFSSDAWVLEPSAGNGALSRLLLERGNHVTSIEVHPDRCKTLRETLPVARHHVVEANFLDWKNDELFDAVVMNPPFYRTHFIEHIQCAHDHLKSGGVLYAICPIGAAINESRAYVEFRCWLEENYHKVAWRSFFEDLPIGAFASSGTNVSTTIIKARKK